jgi:hypothetical protein
MLDKIMVISLLSFPIPSLAASLDAIDCSKMKNVKASSNDGKQISMAIANIVNRYQGELVSITELRVINKVGNWYIVEFELDKLEPGIMVFRRNANKYELMGEFGGYVEDERPENKIRQYLLKKIPSAPKELFYCYMPKGSPFRHDIEK